MVALYVPMKGAVTSSILLVIIMCVLGFHFQYIMIRLTLALLRKDDSMVHSFGAKYMYI